MQLIREFENFNPFRTRPGKLPLSYLLRNMVFDTVFYDVGGLSAQEHADLIGRVVDFDEGGMLVVWPQQAERKIEYFALSADLVAAHPDLDAVAIAGVGSSPLGTAALARQVADAHGAKVVGVISGYGAADVISEALGGWIDFGRRNHTRAAIEQVRALGVAGGNGASADALKAEYRIPSDYLLVDEPESNTPVNLMLRHGDKLRLLVGHSKGALNIQNAAHGFELDPRAAELSIDRLRDHAAAALSPPRSVRRHLRRAGPPQHPRTGDRRRRFPLGRGHRAQPERAEALSHARRKPAHARGGAGVAASPRERAAGQHRPPSS